MGREVRLEAVDRLLQNFRPFTEREASVMPRCVGLVIERGDRNRRYAGVFGDVPAERHIVAVEPQRCEVGGDEAGPMRRQHVEANCRETGRQLIAPRLQISGQ